MLLLLPQPSGGGCIFVHGARRIKGRGKQNLQVGLQKEMAVQKRVVSSNQSDCPRYFLCSE